MYLHEEQFYLISNSAVARNTIFCDSRIQLHFKNKMEKYLLPLCDILAYNFRDHEFQILVKLKEREVFEEFYQAKMESRSGHFQTPESTYIFSQAMSNLQVSLVKKFNFLYNRTGTLLCGRFKREHLESKESVIKLIQELNKGKQKQSYSGIWAKCAMKRINAMTSENMYKHFENGEEREFEQYWSSVKSNLVGEFNEPVINEKFMKFNFLNLKVFHSICRNFG